MSRLRIETDTLRIPFRDPFRISRDMSGEVAVTVVVQISSDADREAGRRGLGEGFPDTYYGENPDTMAAVMPLLLEAVQPFEERLGRDPDETRAALVGASTSMDAAIRHHGAAKCALDIALHDLAARRMRMPLHDLLGLSRDIPPTDFTIGIDTPDMVGWRASRASRFPALKIKVGGPADIETLEAVRAVYDGPIRVDANTGWHPDQAVAMLPDLERLGVELIEQPFPATRLQQLRWLQERSSLPIVADESCVVLRGPREPRWSGAGRQRQTREVRWGRSRETHVGACPRARVQAVSGLHGGDQRWNRRVRRRRVAGRLG